VTIAFWLFVGACVAAFVAAYLRQAKSLRIAREGLADVPATLLRFGVPADDDDRAAWIPALISSTFPSKVSSDEACLVRRVQEQLVLRRGHDLQDVSLSVEHFRKMRFLRNGGLIYSPTGSPNSDEMFVILLRQEELANLGDVRWHRAMPFFLRWWFDRVR